MVFNPASGRGRGGARMPAYLELLERHVPGFRHHVTNGPGQEAELADRAIAEGAGTVVAVGGDGTWSHVADRVVAAGGAVRFGILPSGTGNDFGRSLGIDFASPEDAVRVLAGGHTRKVDVGRITSLGTHERHGGASGAPDSPRHFLNLVGFGFDIAVIDAARGARFLRGEVLYKVTALTQLFRFPGVELELEASSGAARKGRHLMLTISNGRFFGGGFPIVPGARLDDGLLHACSIGDAPPLRRADLFSKAGKGLHVGAPEVEVMSAAAFEVHFATPPRYEVDGDVFDAGGCTVAVEILPGALEVVAP